MRKILVIAGLVMALSFASAKGYFGVFAGYPETLGAQYTMDNNMRFSLGLPFFGGFGVVGSADMILGSGPLGVEGMDLSYYYGAGASAFFVSYPIIGSDFGLNGHGLAGLELMLPNSNLGIFWELQLGVGYGSLTGFWPFYGGRLGVNFH
ncbi:hypothetical protein [Oceanithermus sp.]